MNLQLAIKQQQGQGAVLLALASILGGYFYHNQVYTPALPAIAADSAQWAKLQNDNQMVRMQLTQMGIPRLKKRIAMYEQLRGELDALVPPTDSLVYVMRRIDEAAAQTGAIVSAIRPDSASIGAEYAKRSYKITTVSSWNELGALLTHLASARHIMRPTKLKLEPAGKNDVPQELAARKTAVKATFVLETFWHATPRDSSEILRELNAVFGTMPPSMIATDIPAPPPAPPSNAPDTGVPTPNGGYKPIEPALDAGRRKPPESNRF